ncbi:MAG TPA: hypothetical protein PLS60_09960 [Arenimonas sp.]|nr:hypothetical protein [Arenimonas sp.]HPO23255.1 hypothetical protein [Arenimonas sp.]
MSDEYLGEDQPARRTTPTWELELLISGATVFGLMQLPDPLNRALIVMMNGNEGPIVDLVRTVSIYLQFSLITLIITFVLHLLARAYWVAIVGMYSVYPQGIRWENKNTTGGPAYREFGKNEMGSMPDQIERADNRATKIFGLGFGMAMAMLIASAVVGLMILIMMIVQVSNGDMEVWNTAMWAVLGVLFLPFFTAYLVDFQFGEKLKEKGMDGWIKKIFQVYRKVGIGNGVNPVISLYTSNEGAQKTSIMMALVMIPLMFGVGIFTATRGSAIDNGAYDGLPKPQLGAELVVRPEYYSNSRGDEFSTTMVPFIEDSVVSTNFLRLFIPYQPNRFNEFLRKKCPDSLVRKLANQGKGLDCLSNYFAIQIDTQVTKHSLLSATDPETGQRGMVAMIDVRELSNGQHLLKVKVMPKDTESSEDKEPTFHKIPFWK